MKRWHECSLEELRQQLPTFTLKRLRDKLFSIPPAELPALLNSDEVQSRMQSLAAEAKPEQHRYDPTPARKSHIAGAGRRFVVLNRQGVAIHTTRDEETAVAQAELTPGRQLVDLKGQPHRKRIQLSNALARHMGSTIFEPPKPRAIPFHEAPEPKRDERAEMLAELRSEISALHLPDDQATELFEATRKMALWGQRDAALDLIREVSRLQYTDLLDLATGQRWHFDNCFQAARVSRRLIANRAVLYDEKGRNTGKLRFKTVKPEATQ